MRKKLQINGQNKEKQKFDRSRKEKTPKKKTFTAPFTGCINTTPLCAWCVRGVCVRAYPDVSILVVFGKVKHVIESHHAWRNLGKIHGWIDMILGKHKYRVTLNTYNWLLIVSLCHFMLSQPRINKNKVCKNITSSVFSCWGRKNTLIKYFQNKLITAITVSNIYMLEQHKVPPVTICM